MDRLKKYWMPLAIGLVVLFVLGLFVVQWLRPERLLAYELKQENVVATLTITGEVEADHTVDVSPPVTARIETILVDDGDAVVPGQLLAALEQSGQQAGVSEASARLAQSRAALRFLEQGTRKEEKARIQASYAESKAQLAQQEAALVSAQAELADAKRDAERMKQLYADEVISAQEFDRSQTRAKVAQQEVDRLSANVLAAKSRVTQTREQLNQAKTGPTVPEIQEARAAAKAAAASVNSSQSRLWDRQLKSPMTGVVLKRLQDVGDLATPGQPILRIADRSTIELTGFVEEVDLPRVSKGNKAHVVLDALPEMTIDGQITQVGHEVDPQNGTVEVTVVLKPSDEVKEKLTLMPGMTADINIVTARLKSALVVPASAIQKTNGTHNVYTFNGRKLKRQPVKVKRVSLEYYQILDGLSSGDWVARFADDQLVQKNNVTPRPTALESAAPIK